MRSTLVFNLEKIAHYANLAVPMLACGFFYLGYFHSFYWHFVTVTFILLTVIISFYRHVQRHHALLANFGFIAQGRYLLESIGPDLRQYLFASDTEERASIALKSIANPKVSIPRRRLVHSSVSMTPSPSCATRSIRSTHHKSSRTGSRLAKNVALPQPIPSPSRSSSAQ
jgi:hypothetical protein